MKPGDSNRGEANRDWWLRAKANVGIRSDAELTTRMAKALGKSFDGPKLTKVMSGHRAWQPGELEAVAKILKASVNEVRVGMGLQPLDEASGVNTAWLRTKMAEAKLSEAQLALRLGVLKVQLSKMLQDRTLWDTIHISKAAIALDITPDEFSLGFRVNSSPLLENTELPPESVVLPALDAPLLGPDVESWAHVPHSRNSADAWLFGARLHARRGVAGVEPGAEGELCALVLASGERWVAFLRRGSQPLSRAGLPGRVPRGGDRQREEGSPDRHEGLSRPHRNTPHHAQHMSLLPSTATTDTTEHNTHNPLAKRGWGRCVIRWSVE